MKRFMAAADAILRRMPRGAVEPEIQAEYDAARAALVEADGRCDRCKQRTIECQCSQLALDEIAKAEDRGYRRATEDVGALLRSLARLAGDNAGTYRVLATRIDEEGEHIGAAARAKEQGRG